MDKFVFSTNSIPEPFRQNPRYGGEYLISTVSSLNQPKDGSLMFMAKIPSILPMVKRCLLIVPNSFPLDTSPLAEDNHIMLSSNPRLDYARLLSYIVSSIPVDVYTEYGGHACVGQGVHIGEGVAMAPFVFVDHNAVIGKGTVLKTGVKIGRYVVIGENCVIGENTVVGN